MNQQQHGSTQPPSTESSADPFFNQARKIEQDMHHLMTRQVKLAIVQIVLAILGIIAGFIIATFG